MSDEQKELEQLYALMKEGKNPFHGLGPYAEDGPWPVWEHVV